MAQERFEDAVVSLARQVRSFSESRRGAVERLKTVVLPEAAWLDFLERELVIKIGRQPFDGAVSAVDGGVIASEYQSVDLFLYKTCGVTFDYHDGECAGYRYYPSPLPQVELKWDSSLDTADFNWVKNLTRVNAELECCLGVLKSHAPKLLLMDGSIVPQVGDRPASGSSARALFDDATARLAELFSECRSRGVLLAGVVKDSRGSHLARIFAGLREMAEFRDVLSKTNDVTLLHDFLPVGSRTAAFKYASEQSESSVLKDLGEWSKRVAVMYLKPAPFDRPLRVDFLANSSEDISKIATAVDALSAINKSYAYPAVLIEADLRAAMDGRELDFAESALAARLGRAPEIASLRRDSRPFR